MLLELERWVRALVLKKTALHGYRFRLRRCMKCNCSRGPAGRIGMAAFGFCRVRHSEC